MEKEKTDVLSPVTPRHAGDCPARRLEVDDHRCTCGFMEHLRWLQLLADELPSRTDASESVTEKPFPSEGHGRSNPTAQRYEDDGMYSVGGLIGEIEDLEKKRNAQQRISSQRVREIADACPECRGYLGRSDIECLRQLAGQLERDARVIEAARELANEAEGFWAHASRDAHGHTNMQVMRLKIDAAKAALADLDRREETR